MTIPARALERLRRTRVGQVVEHRVLRRGPRVPLVSVVVPVHDAAPYLAACLDRLVQQTHPAVDVVLVDDGSTDGSRDIAARYAAAHDNVLLLTQSHQGIGAARNHGAQHATGDYLAFCDADDLVRPAACERLVEILERSGSDLAIGSVEMQRYGQFEEPSWARRSNPVRREGLTLDQAPEIMANQVLGARLFRRSFWDGHGFTWPTDTEHPDAVLLVRTLLQADRFDVLPAVVYQWRWRDDMRSSVQRDLREAGRVAERVDTLVRAGELLARRSEEIRRQFLVEILHTTVPDLVRAAVCRTDGYWEALSTNLRRLVDLLSRADLQHVAVEERIIAWLCAHDERTVAEDFLEYSRDNRFGYPYRRIGSHSYIDLPYTDAVVAADDDLIRISQRDMRYRTRLTTVRWERPGLLHVEGAAYVEYVGDDAGESSVDLLLREHRTGKELTVPTYRPAESAVNQWSMRAHEDHEGGAFAADIDVDELEALNPEASWQKYDVLVRLRIAGLKRVRHFQTRQTNGSAGLLEVSRHGDVEAVPRWGDFRGLAVVVREPREHREPRERSGAAGTEEGSTEEAEPPAEVTVDDLVPAEEELEVTGTTDAPALEVALHGPRTHTPWVPATVADGRFHARAPVCVDEWGLGATSLPIDNYRVMARLPDGTAMHVSGAPVLRRRVPLTLDGGRWSFLPNATPEGRLWVRIEPCEVKHSRPPYYRQLLRGQVYEPARREPLLPAVIFETFAGKAAGDNPGPLCEEVARRDLGLDLAFSIADPSTVVPEGARPVLRFSREWHELMARARYVVSNANLPYFFDKREDQTYLQTWHGSPLKRLAHDRPEPDFDNWHHRRRLSESVAKWDFLVSQSDFCTRSLRSAFRYDGDVLETGYPRNDVLTSPRAGEVRRRTRELLGVAEDQQVILYAPTWRDNLRRGFVFSKVIYLDTHAVVAKIDDAVVLVRGHYNTIGAPTTEEADQRIKDVTRYPDISDLYLAADALVTDYSSVFFDFAITDKPMAFIAPDLEQYRDETRGFYLDYHATVPGPVCDTTADVIDVLQGPDEYAPVRQSFRARFAPLDDGQASRRVVDAVFGAEA